MIRLMVGEMDLEEMQSSINRLRKSQLFDELVNQSDAAVRRSDRSAGEFKTWTWPPHHRLRHVFRIVLFV